MKGHSTRMGDIRIAYKVFSGERLKEKINWKI
jgi:hypothetical protein